MHRTLRIVLGGPQLLALFRCTSCKIFANQTRSVASIVAVIATQGNYVHFQPIPFEHPALIVHRFGCRKV